VAKRYSAAGRKRRTREHVIADLSANHVERHALLCGFSAERVVHDYGIDLFLHTYNRRGENENGQIIVQLKATDHLRAVADGQYVACRVERADVAFWLHEPMPVILVLYDARKDVAYWLYLQAFFKRQADFESRRLAQRPVLLIPGQNVLDRRAMRRFVRFKKTVLAQQRGLHHDADE
jgi:hypothetical protein